MRMYVHVKHTEYTNMHIHIKHTRTRTGWQDTGSYLRVHASSSPTRRDRHAFDFQSIHHTHTHTHIHTLTGWQDTGSVLRVHASSSLQPDVISVFEAEQLVLAPGDWAPDALALFGLSMNVSGVCWYTYTCAIPFRSPCAFLDAARTPARTSVICFYV